jgi:COP9 signalosome complex subunit 2
VENTFYEADDLKREDPARAIELFEKVVALEAESHGDAKWTFSSLKNLVVLNCQMEQYQKMIVNYQNMLLFISSVTKNECTNAINDILDKISKANDIHVLSKMYEITLEALKTAKNESMWFNTNIKLAKLYLESNKRVEIERLITVLKKSCQLSDGSDDESKGMYLLEIYCIEIQLCSMLNDAVRLRLIYPKINKYTERATVADPRVMGVIREELGKMFMRENNWDAAYNELNEAFRKFQGILCPHRYADRHCGLLHVYTV